MHGELSGQGEGGVIYHVSMIKMLATLKFKT